MLSYLNEKLRRWTQIENQLQRDDKYSIFHGSHENFLKNGAWVLEESISLFHGRANPIRHISNTELNSMNVEGLPTYQQQFYSLYKASWEGRVVMVKRASNLRYRENLLREMVVATQIVTHNNIHKLLACCLETESPVLVYEWVAPQTLKDFKLISDEDQNHRTPNTAYNFDRTVLEWKDRLRIAWEISHAIAYLHTAFHRPIIIGDLTYRSVFIDDGGAAKLSDLSSCVSIPEGEVIVVDYLVGTFSYMAPEYAVSGKVSVSVDVYSFGILLLMLLTSQETHYLKWVQNGNCTNIGIDPRVISDRISVLEGLQLRASIHLALQCVVEEGDHRPSMVDVATMLKDMITYPENILDSSGIKEESFFRIFRGSKENFVRNETLVIQESISLFHGKANPVCYFSVNDLNRMKVHFPIFCSHKHFNWYLGSWEGKDVLLKLPKILMDNLRSSDDITLMYVREIVIATQMATNDNVHKLIGCCLETVTPVLIYEWLSCETLKDHINLKKLPPLHWKDRLRISWEISQVVSYLHSGFSRPIVHKFLKSKNIFLDQKKTTKLYNFSHSIVIPQGEEFVTHNLINSAVNYMAPEYYNHGKVAQWTDVYSFGILCFELLTGKNPLCWCENEGEQNSEPKYLIDWITQEIGTKNISSMVDPSVINDGPSMIELRAFIELARKCTSIEEDKRPTMEDIATELKNMIVSSKYITSAQDQ